jgi:hypothetical protein
MPNGSLRDACSPARLKQLAGRPSYQRGERYAAERRVMLLRRLAEHGLRPAR